VVKIGAIPHKVSTISIGKFKISSFFVKNALLAHLKNQKIIIFLATPLGSLMVRSGRLFWVKPV
jgi:hypothetical protein